MQKPTKILRMICEKCRVLKAFLGSSRIEVVNEIADAGWTHGKRFGTELPRGHSYGVCPRCSAKAAK